jgi:hypothetical protein
MLIRSVLTTHAYGYPSCPVRTSTFRYSDSSGPGVLGHVGFVITQRSKNLTPSRKGEEKEDKIHHRDAEGTKTDIFFTEGNEGNEGYRGQRVTKEAKN